MRVLLIKGDSILNVRVAKYIRCFHNNHLNVSYWGWNRNNNDTSSEYIDELSYLLLGGGYGGKRLLFYYLIWGTKLFFKSLLTDLSRYKSIIAINFDSALPLFLASRFRRIDFIYEIHDEFALSYPFPVFCKKFIQWIDHMIMRASSFVIHVDENRVSYDKCENIVIENSPLDFFDGNQRLYKGLQHQFAVIGNISSTRGIDQIIKFAKDHCNVELLVVGKFYDLHYKQELLSLPKIHYYDYMPQNDLFRIMDQCCGIFSLYDPSLEINRLAASNKVYDAMMLGIPVITNKEVINSSFIQENRIGIVVDFYYNDTWSILSQEDFPHIAEEIGKKGRDLYLKDYRFDSLVKDKLIKRIVDK